MIPSGVQRFDVLVESSDRVIRYVCTREAHVNAPLAMGYAMAHAFAWAWCPSIEAAGHHWTQIKDMRSRIAEFAAVLDALRKGAPADTGNGAGAVVIDAMRVTDNSTHFHIQDDGAS